MSILVAAVITVAVLVISAAVSVLVGKCIAGPTPDAVDLHYRTPHPDEVTR